MDDTAELLCFAFSYLFIFVLRYVLRISLCTLFILNNSIERDLYQFACFEFNAKKTVNSTQSAFNGKKIEIQNFLMLKSLKIMEKFSQQKSSCDM